MDKRDFVKRLYAGIFFIIGVLLIFVVILAIGIEKGFTQPKFQVTVLFREVAGLSVGAPIRLSGVNIGTVSGIDFLEERIDGRAVKVVLNIFIRYRKQLEKASSFAIKTEGLLGAKLIEISMDQGGQHIDLSKTVIGEDPLDVQGVAEAFKDTALSLTETSRGINTMTQEFKYISKTTKRLLDRIEERLMNGNLFKLF